MRGTGLYIPLEPVGEHTFNQTRKEREVHWLDQITVCVT